LIALEPAQIGRGRFELTASAQELTKIGQIASHAIQAGRHRLHNAFPRKTSCVGFAAALTHDAGTQIIALLNRQGSFCSQRCEKQNLTWSTICTCPDATGGNPGPSLWGNSPSNVYFTKRMRPSATGARKRGGRNWVDSIDNSCHLTSQVAVATKSSQCGLILTTENQSRGRNIQLAVPMQLRRIASVANGSSPFWLASSDIRRLLTKFNPWNIFVRWNTDRMRASAQARVLAV